ncbi:MAG: tRNA (adenosine(37)-N6)-threonylcarbamoyltransferase complex dimerization subunit type 1 TsaB [Halanaerobiales bacterium]
MIVLGIDTSSEICSVGLSSAEDFLGEINIKLKRRHSERLLPIIKNLLSESGYKIQEIEGLAVTDGPGSFTGLRIGLSTVQAFKKALGVPVYSVSTLEYMAYSIAQHYDEESILIPTIDARNKRVYTAVFKRSGNSFDVKRIDKDKAVEVEQLISDIKKYKKRKIIFGTGADQYFDILQKSELSNTKLIYKTRNFGGYNLARLGYKQIRKGVDTDYKELTPTYLKKPQARINWEKKYLQGDKNGDKA